MAVAVVQVDNGGSTAIVEIDSSAPAIVVAGPIQTPSVTVSVNRGQQGEQGPPGTGGGGLTAEDIMDLMSTFLVQGANISLDYDDVGDTLTIAVTGITVPTTEDIQDAVGAMFVDSTEIDFTYNDGAGTETASLKDGTVPLSRLAVDPLARANHTGSQLSTTISDFGEAVQDVVGALAFDSATIDVTYDDVASTITFVIVAGSVTNAMLAGGIALSKLATDPLARANHTGTQLAATISDFAEAVDDRVAALVQNGDGIVETYDDAGNTETIGLEPILLAAFSANNNDTGLATFVGKGRLRNESGYTKTITKIVVTAGSAPTGAAMIWDVNKGGVTLFTTQANRPTIADGANVSSTTLPDIVSWAQGEYLTTDLDQIGTTFAGDWCTVEIWGY